MSNKFLTLIRAIITSSLLSVLVSPSYAAPVIRLLEKNPQSITLEIVATDAVNFEQIGQLIALPYNGEIKWEILDSEFEALPEVLLPADFLPEPLVKVERVGKIRAQSVGRILFALTQHDADIVADNRIISSP
jgi:hypothetical protein